MRLLIYGAGKFACALIHMFPPEQRRDVLILDKYSNLSEINGIRIVRPDSDEALSSKSVPVLNTVLGYEVVYSQLHDLGYTNVLRAENVFRLYPESLVRFVDDKFMWRDLSKSTAIKPSEKKHIKSIFSDEASRDLFDLLLSFRSSPSYLNYPWPRNTIEFPMYFPDDIPGLYDVEAPSIVDIGSYDGDTLSDFVSYFSSSQKPISSYCCIEASSENIENLQARVERIDFFDRHVKNFSIKRGLVGVDNTKDGRFVDRGSASSCVFGSGCDLSELSYPPILQLNEILSCHCPNIIKMDIEGSDFSALLLMRQFVSENSPQLALSVYHYPSDLWRMALLIDSWVPGKYSFYLRQEGHWGLETQLYALPQ